MAAMETESTVMSMAVPATEFMAAPRRMKLYAFVDLCMNGFITRMDVCIYIYA
jgi:DNA relaxase NicK